MIARGIELITYIVFGYLIKVLIKEDVSKFEAELISAISSRSYDKLSLCPSPVAGRHQQYKIEKIQ